MRSVFEAGGVTIPKLGLGTFNLHDRKCEEAVADGIAAGFRHIDTAEMYQNETAVGAAIRASGVAREDIFVTSKVWHDHLSEGLLQAAAEASLKRLGFDYMDLFLIHWPNPDVPLAEAIGALNAVRSRGLARAIGVSNFPSKMIHEAAALSEAPLAVNQVEYHPYLDQSAVLAALREHGMGLTAYCPLARGRVLRDPVLKRIADVHATSPATLALAWLLSHDDVIAIPKSGSRARMEENVAAYNVVLSADEIAEIGALSAPDGRMIDPIFAPRWDDAA